MMMTALTLVLCGCSRDEINYQLAESIGTVGEYENGEPVETPKMKQEREQKESQEAADASFDEQLQQVMNLAAGYWYDEALEMLDGIDPVGYEDRIEEARTGIETAQSSLTLYEGSIAHLCFPTLIADTMMAFDGDARASTYASSMITVTEFERILDSLYAKGYILIDIHDIAGYVTDERGTTTFEQLPLYLPAGKLPLIISQDNVNYSQVTNGDGIATCLVLDDDGQVKAQYTDSGGHDLVGDYDLVPVLDTFIEEHPDFSYRGAKGIVSVSGKYGVFGYDTQEGASVLSQAAEEAESEDDDATSTSAYAKTSSSSGSLPDGATEDQKTAAAIAGALTENGWSIASAGYAHTYMNDLNYYNFVADMTSWLEEVAPIVGSTDILFYPYGGEVGYPSDQLTWLLENGFTDLCGLWSAQDYLEVQETYMRQTRRFIDGYTLTNASGDFTGFFDTSSVLDTDR